MNVSLNGMNTSTGRASMMVRLASSALVASGLFASLPAMAQTSASDASYQPLETTITRTDGDQYPVLGSTITFTITVKNPNPIAGTLYPRASNLTDFVVQSNRPNCRHTNFNVNEVKSCDFAHHVVTREDVDRGYFIPEFTYELNANAQGAGKAFVTTKTTGKRILIGNNIPAPDTPPLPKPPLHSTPLPTVPPTAPRVDPKPQPTSKPDAPGTKPESTPNPHVTAVPTNPPVATPAPMGTPPAAGPANPNSPSSPSRPSQPGGQTRPEASKVERISGPSRIETAIQIARMDFPSGADTVVLTRSDRAVDSVAAIPLAKAMQAPVLLTQPDQAHPAVLAQINALKPKKVVLLGGNAALSDAVEQAVKALGPTVERLAGANRADTAVHVAKQLEAMGHLKQVVIADGTDWQPSLLAGPAAATVHGATLLTNGSTVSPETQAFLATKRDLKTSAIGARAVKAYPKATPVDGANATELSLRVATTFFGEPKVAGVATSADFADALTGGAHIAHKNGPLLLVPTASSNALTTWMKTAKSVNQVYIYGGEARISTKQAAELMP